MRVVQLAFILRLMADSVKCRVDGVSISGLRAPIELYASEYLVIIAEGIIDAADKEHFLVTAAARQSDRAEAVRGTARQGIQGCTSDARTGIGRRDCIGRSLGAVVEGKRLLIKARGGGRDLGENIALKGRRGQEGLGGGGEDVTQSFGVHEEVSLVLLDRSTKVRGPLVVVLEGFRLSAGFKEIVFGVQIAACVVVVGAAVKRVGAGARAVVDLRARHAAVLAGVTVADHGDFLHVIATEQQVAGAGVVQVKKWVVIVVAIHSEKIGSTGQAKSTEIAIARAARCVHGNAWSGLGNVGNVVAGIWNTLDGARIKGCGDIRVFGLQQVPFA